MKPPRFRVQPGITREQLLHAEMVNLLYIQSRTAVVAYLALIPVIAFILWDALPHVALFSCLGIATLASLWRFRVVFAYDPSTCLVEDMPGHERRFIVSLFLAGASWGLTGFVFPAWIGGHDELILGIALVGLSGGAMGTFGFHRRAYAVFVWPLLAPYLVRAILGGTGDGYLVALVVLLYLAITTRIVRNFHLALREAWVRNLDQDEKIGELTQLAARLRRSMEDTSAAANSLASTNAMLNAMLSSSHVLMACLDRDFNFVLVNDAYARADKRAPEEFIGLNHFALFPNEENERIFRRVLQTGQPYRADARLFTYPDHPEWGASYWDVDLLPVRGEDGRILGVLLALLDVSARQHALRTLQEREQYLSATLDAMVDGLIVTDAEGHMTGITPSVLRMFGYAEAELMGRNISLLVGGTDRERHDEYLKKHTATPVRTLSGRRLEGQGRRRDGSEFPVEVTVSEAVIGGRRMYVGLIRDIGERMAMEAKITDAMTRLEDEKRRSEAANEQLSRANEELHYISGHDALTGLPNRRFFDEFSLRLWRHAKREGTEISVLLLDVDHFKRYNDHYGHLAGDACLQRIAEILQQHVQRPSDIVARYGGEEFIAILADTGSEGARHVAEKILADVRTEELPHQASPRGIVTVSAGIASVVPASGLRLERLIKRTDDALYRAKNSGRDRIETDGDLSS